MKGIGLIRFFQLVTIIGCLVHPLFLDQGLRSPDGGAAEGSCLAPTFSLGTSNPLSQSLLEVVLGQEAGPWGQWNPRMWGG